MKMTIYGVVIALLTLIAFMTFTQEAFVTPVSAKILMYKTPEIPVIYYITGAFILGLLIGLFVAISTHFKLTKEIKLLKKAAVEGDTTEQNGDIEDDSESEI